MHLTTVGLPPVIIHQKPVSKPKILSTIVLKNVDAPALFEKKMIKIRANLTMNKIYHDYTDYEERQVNMKLLYILYVDCIAIACLIALLYM